VPSAPQHITPRPILPGVLPTRVIVFVLRGGRLMTVRAAAGFDFYGGDTVRCGFWWHTVLSSAIYSITLITVWCCRVWR
jgi:hypothetical protein